MAVDYSKLRSLASGVPVSDPITLTAEETADASGSGADAVINTNKTRIAEIESVLASLGVIDLSSNE